jgi:L-seryl-tRNA(Ser) seleniumtransferase
MSDDHRERLARLPQVDAVVRALGDDAAAHGPRVVADTVRAAIGTAREQVLTGAPPPAIEDVAAEVRTRLAERDLGRLRRVVNATGVVLHTNLGRAPLSPAARAAVAEAAGYTTLEYDVVTGARGSRTANVAALAAELCGAEDATVVNNGAAALLLVLATLSADRGTVVSRGELVEIGGSYRLPEVMQTAGVRLQEVGTTNRTRIGDYAAAIDDDTALLLKVHRSNFAIVGFTEEAGVGELAALGAAHGLPVVHDVGSGLIEPAEGALSDEPSVTASLKGGADLVVFSGDKLLGGPQAGVIVGRGDLVAACRRHPLARAVRIDKLQRAAMEATLAAHLRGTAVTDVPTVAALATDPSVLRSRAERLAASVGGEVVETVGLVGGGTAPQVRLPSWGVRVGVNSPESVAQRLRRGDPAVVVRVEDAAIIVDVRTVDEGDDALLADRVVRCRE